MVECRVNIVNKSQNMAYFKPFLIVLSFSPLGAWAIQCAVDPLAQFMTLEGDREDEQLYVESDLSVGDFTQTEFEGAVKLRYRDMHLQTPRLRYSPESGKAELPEGGVFSSPHLALRVAEGQYNANDDSGTFVRGEYVMKNEQGQIALGAADNIQVDRDNQHGLFHNVTWTTCERASPTWNLQAKSLRVDNVEERAYAYDATFRIKDTPIFYLPYISFPVSDKRASGFLLPSAGSSSARGFEVSVPYYFNIAPNQDATVVLRPMSKRGLMMEGEYRYLGENQNLEVQGTFLPSDMEGKHNHRWSTRLQHQYRFNEQWTADTLYQSVSDLNYFGDFKSPVRTYDDWYYERYFRIDGQTDYGNVLFRFQDFERVDSDVLPGSNPYSRLPQLRYSNNWQADGWRIDLHSDFTRFYKKELGSANRFDNDISVAYRWDRPYGYLQPQASLSVSHYDFGSRDDSLRGEKITRTLPTFSIDGKLEFERDFHWLGDSWSQTLEPRLFYLYTPYKDQSMLPLFDSAERDLSWEWLFARNRFSGADRIGDANQLTTAVTSRFFRNSDGQEKLNLSLGQIQYFADRKVRLYGNEAQREGKSELVVAGKYNIDRHWSLGGIHFWDMDTGENRRSRTNLRYTLDSDRFVDLSHYYNRDDYDQVSLSGVWRINERWRGFARQDYSFHASRAFNSVLGVEYDDCCWAWRLAGRHYRDSPEANESHNAVFLEFVFKGLGNMGSRSGSMLEKQINGFKRLPEENEF